MLISKIFILTSAILLIKGQSSLYSWIWLFVNKMSRARFKPKEIKKPKFNSSHNYQPLIPNDALYRPNLGLLKDPNFKTMLERLTADINFLLMMND